MTVLQEALRLELKNNPLVFIRFPLPLAFPGNVASLPPIRDDSRAKHVLPDGIGIHKRTPYFRRRSVHGYGSLREHVPVHTRLPCILQVYRPRIRGQRPTPPAGSSSARRPMAAPRPVRAVISEQPNR